LPADADHRSAIQDYDQAIMLDANNELSYTNRSNACGFLGDLDVVIAGCSKAIDIDPQLAVAYENRGGMKFRKQQFVAALEDIERALAIEPARLTSLQARSLLKRLISR